MADQPSFQHRIPKTVINVLTLAPGARVHLVGNAIAEVVANPQVASGCSCAMWRRQGILSR